MRRRKTRVPLIVLGTVPALCFCSLALAALWIGVTSAGTLSYTPPSLATPGVIYQPNATDKLPMPLETWQYQEDTLLLHYVGNWEWFSYDPKVALYNWRTDETQVLGIPDLDPTTHYAFAQGPDTNLIAYADWDDIYLFDIAAALSRKLTSGDDPTFSPDGLQLAFWRGPNLRAVNLTTTAETVLHTAQDVITGGIRHWQDGCCSTWSPDGAAIAFQLQQLETISGTTGTSSIDLVVLDLDSQGLFTVASVTRDEYISPVTWSPDGRLVLYVENEYYTGDSTIYIADWRANCLVGELSLDDIHEAYWSPAGDVIAVANGAQTWLYFVEVLAAFGADYLNLSCLP